MTTTITLFCLIHGDNPADCAFPVKTTKVDTVGDLKKLVKEAQPLTLSKVDDKNITLWRVNIPSEALPTLNPYFDFKAQGNKLSPLSKIAKVFPDESAEEHLHIIVETPPVLKRVTIAATYEKKECNFIFALERHKITLLVLCGQVYQHVKLPQGIREEDMIVNAAFDSTSVHTPLYNDEDLANFVGTDNAPVSLSIVVNTTQQPYSVFSFNKMKVLFDILCDNYAELPQFTAGIAEIKSNILESVIDELLRRCRGCFQISGANEATRKHFIGCVLWGVVEHYEGLLKIIVECNIAGTNGKGPVDFAIKHAMLGLIVGITEAKKEDLNDGIGQNAVQLQSSLQFNHRKRTHDEMVRENSLYGVVTTAENWVITKVMVEDDGKTRLSISDRLTLSLPLADQNLTRETFREPLKNIMGQIRWVFDQQIEPQHKRPRRTSPRLASRQCSPDRMQSL